MSGGRIGDVPAVADFAASLSTLAQEGQRQLAECNGSIESISERCEVLSARRRSAIHDTQALIEQLVSALSDCQRQEDSNCSGIEADLTAARHRLEEHLHLESRLNTAYRSFVQEVGEFRSASSTFAGALVDGESHAADLQQRLAVLTRYTS